MFGDILMWALTVFGLIPMLKVLFGPKKTFQEQLAEYSDDIPDNDDGLRADWIQLGEHVGESCDVECPDHDAEAADFDRFLQELGECGHGRRFSMLEDFWNNHRNSTRSTSTGPS